MKKIRGIQITGKQVHRIFKRASTGQPTKEIVYIKDFEKMTVDTDDGSWGITAEEIVAFLIARRKE